MQHATDSEPIWRPPERRTRDCNMRRFIDEHRGELAGNDYAALYAWSITEPSAFWAGVWRFCDIRADGQYRQVVQHYERMPGAVWFEGATLNFACNLLAPERDGAALIFHSESGERVELSWDELRRQVANVAASLRTLGVGPGDRVAAFLPNRPETVVAMLATASLGAVWSSCSPDFGVPAVLERFGQIEPKVLFAVDGYFYAGKRIDTLRSIEALAHELPTLNGVIVVPYLNSDPDLQAVRGALRFADAAAGAATLVFESVPFSHPLFILYSSGTTGAPKCIVHSVGGTLIQHKKEHVLHTDIRPGDVVFYFTTCGWMMWNWLVSALASGATLVLFDGAPFQPDPAALWKIAAQERIKVFGTSARYLSALEKTGFKPREHAELPALASILSTGSPLAAESYDFVYRDVKSDVQLSSISGGTDIISCFALGNPLAPVYRSELQCRGLGMKVEIYDRQGRSIEGRKGELVCTAPFPSMPVGFWNDPDERKYRAAYFERFPGVWCHGDYAELTSHDGIIIYGRSDAVLNPGGVRIGTAELYGIVEQLPEVLEAVAVGQEWRGDVRIVLFVRLRPQTSLSEELEAHLRRAIRSQASPRHVPAKILTVTDIPRTINGKIVELAVRDVIHGRPVANLDVLANPEALEQFRNRRELAD
jgi:acetoacetyl-CoA synthetase